MNAGDLQRAIERAIKRLHRAMADVDERQTDLLELQRRWHPSGDMPPSEMLLGVQRLNKVAAAFAASTAELEAAVRHVFDLTGTS